MKKFIVDDYPRPQFRRTSFINLNGKWDFCLDFDQKGSALNYQDGFEKESEINVPFAYETVPSGIGLEKRCDQVWYQKVFAYHKREGKRLLLHLEGSDYLTTVYCNGTEVGFDSGAYHRETFDLTSTLKEGENKLVIRVQDDYSKEKPRGKQRWEDENFGCWYVDTTGIYKTVWMEEVNDVYLQDIVLLPDAKKKEFKAILKLNEASTLDATLRLSYEGEVVASKTFSLTNKESEVKLDIEKDLHLWGSLKPEVYDLDIVLKQKEKKVDEVKSYVAFRTLEAKNGKIYLNDAPIYQKLILDQGYFDEGKLTPKDGEEILRDITLMMDIGFNGARKHQKIEDERFYYYADMLGYIVWGEMPSMYAYTEKSKKTFEREYVLALEQLRNHPSIITWVPFNESWGVDEIAHDKQMQDWVNSICALTKKIDPSRFVISNDGWEHVHSDIITIHDYEQDGDKLKAKFPNALAASTVKYEWRGKGAMADGYTYKGQPMMLTEFGGTAFKDSYGGENKSWGYGEGVKDNLDFLHRLELLVKDTLELDCFEGYCYTQLSDVEQEVNGLVNTKREYKLPKEALKAIFSLNKQ